MDRQQACGFCDGTGLWVDPEAGPGATDPCPLCEGRGEAPEITSGAAEPDAVARVEALLPALTPAERQRVYALLHARYDCRIYRQ